MMESEHKSGKWQEVKKEIQKTWGLLTHDEIERAKGSLYSLAGAIQKKYGMARHDVLDRLSHFIERLSRPDVEKKNESEKTVIRASQKASAQTSNREEDTHA